MTPFWESMVTILGLSATVAIIALMVSKKSQTPQVIQAAASGWGNILGVAESPVTGSGYQVNLSYPGTDMSGSFGYG